MCRLIINKYFIIFIFIISVLSDSYAGSEIGRIIQITGDVDLSEPGSNVRIIPGVGTQIFTNHKIRTGAKAYLEILLNDNTKIFMRELSVIQVKSLKMKAEDSPSRIDFNTGKIRVNTYRQYKNWNLIVKTNAAVIGIRDVETDMGIITTDNETKLVVFEGQAEIASSERDIIKSYNLKKKEESDITVKKAPTEPIVLPSEIADSWLDYYDIDQNKIIIKEKKESGIIDFILRKRKL